MSPRPLPLADSLPLSAHLELAGIRLVSEGIGDALARMTRKRDWNREQAAGVMLERVSTAQLDTVRASATEFERRLTLAARAVEAGGTHPDEIIRVTLGVCAGRLLVEGEPAAIPGLVAIDLLSRLTALDYALLDVSISGDVLVHDAEPSRGVLGDEVPGSEQRRDLPPNVRRPDDVLRVLETHFEGLSVEGVRQSSRRLRRLGLFFPDHAYGQPSPVGREVLRLSKT